MLTVLPVILLPSGADIPALSEYITALDALLPGEEDWWKAQGHDLRFIRNGESVDGRAPHTFAHYRDVPITRYQGNDQEVYFNIKADTEGMAGDIKWAFTPLDDFALALQPGAYAVLGGPYLEGICGRWHPTIAGWANLGLGIDVVTCQIHAGRHELGHCLGYGHEPGKVCTMGDYWLCGPDAPLSLGPVIVRESPQ